MPRRYKQESGTDGSQCDEEEEPQPAMRITADDCDEAVAWLTSRGSAEDAKPPENFTAPLLAAFASLAGILPAANARLADSTPLNGLDSLRVLDLSMTAVTDGDLLTLATADKLTRLSLRMNATLTDVSPLADMAALESLDLRGCVEVRRIGRLGMVARPEELHLPFAVRTQRGDLLPVTADEVRSAWKKKKRLSFAPDGCRCFKFFRIVRPLDAAQATPLSWLRPFSLDVFENPSKESLLFCAFVCNLAYEDRTKAPKLWALDTLGVFVKVESGGKGSFSSLSTVDVYTRSADPSALKQRHTPTQPHRRVSEKRPTESHEMLMSSPRASISASSVSVVLAVVQHNPDTMIGVFENYSRHKKELEEMSESKRGALTGLHKERSAKLNRLTSAGAAMEEARSALKGALDDVDVALRALGKVPATPKTAVAEAVSLVRSNHIDMAWYAPVEKEVQALRCNPDAVLTIVRSIKADPAAMAQLRHSADGELWDAVHLLCKTLTKAS